MMMVSPGLMELFVHPTRVKRLGLVSSPCHFSAVPESSFRFPKNLDVWIDEIEPSDHALYGNRLARIVVRRAVVRERHRCKRQKTRTHGQKTHSTIFHVILYPFDSRFLATFLPENTHRSSDNTH